MGRGAIPERDHLHNVRSPRLHNSAACFVVSKTGTMLDLLLVTAAPFNCTPFNPFENPLAQVENSASLAGVA